MTSRNDAIAHTRRYVDSGGFQTDLAALVAHPTESQRDDRGAELARYLSGALQPELSAAGFDCQIHPNPDPAGGPFLIARRVEDATLPTVLCYGHGDVVHGQPGDWPDGLDPFVLTERGDRLFGRGTADNKAQHLINIAAARAVIATRGALGFNLTFLIEMSEEVGSPGLAAFCAARQEDLAADVLIASDGPRLQPDVATLFMGARGCVNFDLCVDLRAGAQHSGNWGGLLADPAIILTHALACITDRRGQIAIPEWRPDSLSDDIRAVLADLPVEGGDGPQIDPDWGEAMLTPAERVYGWNSFAILAQTSGVPDAPQNAISGQARATCQLRFVVGTDAADILPALRRHLDAQGFGVVQIIPDPMGQFGATRHAPDHPWVQFVQQAVIRSTGQPPHMLPNLAGSLPNECFTDILKLPTIWIPHSYRGCSQHAPGEHVLKPLCAEALQLMAGLYWDIGDPALVKPAPAPARSS